MTLTISYCDGCGKVFSWAMGEPIEKIQVKMYLGMLTHGNSVEICNDCGQFSNILKTFFSFHNEQCFKIWIKKKIWR